MPGERTEQATSHKRGEAKKKGDLLTSRELTSAAGTLAGVTTLSIVGSHSLVAWRGVFSSFLDLGQPSHWEPEHIQSTLVALRGLCMTVIGPVVIIMVAVVGAALAAAMVQTGGINFTVEALGLKPQRLNPITNLQNLFSIQVAARLGKSLVPAIFLAVFATQRISRQLTIPPFSTARLELLGSDIFGLLSTTAWILFAWSFIDYVIQWRSRENRLMMTKQEIKEEMKQMEGSPQIKSRIKGLQRQMRRRRVKADVARAAVVLTNPTHYAVALGFDFNTMDAPKVLAKGRNLLAEEIKAEARWADVPIIENPPLARSLYRHVEIGQAIPADLYAAVAAILAYLYRQRVEGEMRERRAREAAAAQAQATARAMHAAAARKPVNQPNQNNQPNQRGPR